MAPRCSGSLFYFSERSFVEDEDVLWSSFRFQSTGLRCSGSLFYFSETSFVKDEDVLWSSFRFRSTAYYTIGYGPV